METSQPEVPIAVDRRTGAWMTDGLAMIYLPRHFYVNHHCALEAAFGRQALGGVLYEAGYTSAWQWCESQAANHGLRGLEVFRHYMKRISQRGWGRFTITALDEQRGSARIRLEHSIYVEHHGKKTAQRLCYPFAGWFSGSLAWAGSDMGLRWRLESRETHCASEAEHDHCAFDVIAKSP